MTEPSTATWPALGTTAGVATTDARRLPAVRRAVEAELQAIDLACSRFRDDSELSALNAAAGRPVRVGPLLLEAICVALRAAALTGGDVDPTVGGALVLAGYDRDFAPDLTEPARVVARRVPGWRTVSVDVAHARVIVPRGTTLDLGATAKALAADRAAAAAAAAAPGTGVLVNLGGDIAVAGTAPAEGWLVRVTDDHRAPEDVAGQRLTIHAGALATSSTTVRRWGRASHHIVDPRTGRPAASPWRTVSVAAASCIDANTASTAAIVGGRAAPTWLRRRGLPARLVERGGRVWAVAGWPEETCA